MSAVYLRGCAGKKKHPTKSAAYRHRVELDSKGGTPMSQSNAYQCRLCGFWHVGHKENKQWGRGKR